MQTRGEGVKKTRRFCGRHKRTAPIFSRDRQTSFKGKICLLLVAGGRQSVACSLLTVPGNEGGEEWRSLIITFED